MRLQDPAMTDSGVYRYRVDFRKDRARNHETSLLVIGLVIASMRKKCRINVASLMRGLSTKEP
ncbi:hypothetical protein HPB52_016197 [Rhipicephalus sanguineus]|uniref:Uncharacterized protein n=1 Tax=Rhipicephalus sanguineus TaxID=34632 RepID=A0A9D4PRZ5_RHISA|nr:hypothetical protein HPB52_016197 [Rhipicephalus sanguineus]